MAGTVTKEFYVDPDASGTGTGADWTNAYTSLKTAVDDNDGDITSLGGSDEIHIYLCRSSSGKADSLSNSYINLNNYKCSAKNYVVFSGTQDHNGVWDDDIYRIHKTTLFAGDCFSLDGSSDFGFKFDNLQVRNDSTGTFQCGIEINIGSNTPLYASIEIDKCIWRGGKPAGTLAMCFRFEEFENASSSNIIIKNSILYDFSRGIYEINNGGIDNFEVYNCSIIGMAGNAVSNYSNSANIKYVNNIIFGNGSGFRSNLGDVIADYNAIDYDDNEMGDNGIWLSGYSGSDIFTNYTGGNFSLISTSPVIDEGTNLSTSGVTGDIAGNSRGASWDIGPFEYISSVVLTAKYPEYARINYIG